MASSSCSNSSWTPRQNKLFEEALAEFDEKTRDRWVKVATRIGKSPEEVRRHYEILVEDVKRIEKGRVPYPYRSGQNG